MSAHHASATLPAPRFSRAQTWTVLFLFFTGIAFLSFNYKYLDDLARQQGGTLLILPALFVLTTLDLF
jgi:hypothetical protein